MVGVRDVTDLYELIDFILSRVDPTSAGELLNYPMVGANFGVSIENSRARIFMHRYRCGIGNPNPCLHVTMHDGLTGLETRVPAFYQSLAAELGSVNQNLTLIPLDGMSRESRNYLLYECARYGHVVRALLSGPDLNMDVRDWGGAALVEAMRMGDDWNVRELLRHDADLNMAPYNRELMLTQSTPHMLQYYSQHVNLNRI